MSEEDPALARCGTNPPRNTMAHVFGTELFLNAYQAGFVKRHHVNPSDAVQTVGQHSWGVAMILEFIYPECSKALLLAALRHDVAERWTGDVPAYVKWKYPGIAHSFNAAEENVNMLLGYDEDFAEKERGALKISDMLELWLFCGHRVHMGDRYFKQVRQNVNGWFDRNADTFNLFPKARMILNGYDHFSANP